MSSGDPFHGDKRTDETVMIGSDDLSNLVAQAKGGAADPAPAATETSGEAIVAGVEDAAAGSSKTILIVGAVVVALAIIGILVVALG